MTTEQKAAIAALRQQGYGYMKIANHIGVTVGAVKSFCQRNGLRNAAARPDISPQTIHTAERFCKHCGVPVIQTPRARKKLFCSTACRQKWWNAHHEQVKRRAFYTFICHACGKEFTAYGNQGRKYCCHECYIISRFGKERT